MFIWETCNCNNNLLHSNFASKLFLTDNDQGVDGSINIAVTSHSHHITRFFDYFGYVPGNANYVRVVHPLLY